MNTSLRLLVAGSLFLTAGMSPAAADEPTVECDGRPATLIGTPGDDKLIGDASDDVIVGLGGNDTLVGAGGNDIICGFDGDDTIIGGPGDDVLLGGDGSDWLDYRSVYRRIMVDLGAGLAEGHGTDIVHSIENVYGSGRRNYIYGSSDANIIRADGDEEDILWGRGGDDIIEAGRRYAEMRGGPGDDHLSGAVYVTFRDSAIHGGPGNDLIETGKIGTITGGAGDDHIRILGDVSIVHPGAGDDIVEVVPGPRGMPQAIVSYWHAPGPVEVDLEAGIATGWGIDRLSGVDDAYGTRYDDVMRGAPPNGGFRGQGGDDILEAAASDGGSGSDLRGGRGNDVLRGSGGDDLLLGEQGKDMLFGFGGDDSLVGGGGHDEVDGGDGRDLISFRDLDGPLVINLGGQKALGPGADAFVAIESATGSRGDDRIAGTPRADYLDGHLGNDTIRGRAGDDDIRGWGGDDAIYAGFGDDQVSGDTGADLEYGGAGADTISGGPGDDALFGGPGDDELSGGADSNSLDGGPDFDTCRQAATYVSCELIL